MADKKRSPELIALAVKLYGELQSTQKVAKRLELGVSTTHRMLKAAGVVMPGRFDAEVQERKRALQGDTAKMAAMDYAAGMPMAELREKYKTGRWAIKAAARSCGVDVRGRGAQLRKFSDDDKAEVKRLYLDEKWSQGQIAVRFGSSVTTIARICRMLGIDARGKKATGEKHGSWAGGRINLHGYVAVMVSREDPMRCMAHATGYVLEHRLVMARAIGRPLTDYETVHHLDDVKTNNDLSNLQLRFGRHGKGVVLKCRCCGSSDIVPVEL